MHDTVVQWANGLPILDKADLSLPRGEGEKRIIRKVSLTSTKTVSSSFASQALSLLNAPHDAPKQAMQFGSGMVKMEGNKSQKVSPKHHPTVTVAYFCQGSDVSSHLQQSSTLVEG